MKSEKGSVTLLVLIILLVITAFFIGIYILNKNKNWLIIDKDFNKTLKELTYQLPKEGYYLIYDLKTKEYTTFTNMYKETKSRDYLLIILDSQNNELVYLEYHS